MTNPNEPAHPTFEDFRTRNPWETTGHFHGLTKREYFAAKAMQGMLSLHPRDLLDCADTKSETVGAWIATNCVEMADALIAALNVEAK